MNINPFLDRSGLNSPLRPDICQQIHYTALRTAVNGSYPEMLPVDLPLTEFLERRHFWGSEVYLAHPEQIERIFSGVSLAAYNLIEELYCCRLERSIRMVWQILSKLALQANVPPLEYEAIWAICLYLEQRRKDSVDTTVKRLETSWQVVWLHPDVKIQGESGVYRPILLCVLDICSARVLSFRIAHPLHTEEAVSLAIYDAIVSQRQPSQEGSAGLIWRLPQELVTETDLSMDTQNALSGMSIGIKSVPETAGPLLKALQGDWDKNLSGRIFQQHRFSLVFDNYLQKIHRYGPVDRWQDQGREFAQLIGYNRDPAWQFPALRELLPRQAGYIAADGTVAYDGLHYEDPLLAYWPGQPVTLRISEQAEATAWIYLDEDILCQATAQELRRKDGSYRLNRPGRS